MKKLIAAAILLTGSATGIFAQQGPHIGVDGAFNLTFIEYQNTYGGRELKYAPTFNLAEGISAGYNFDNHFGIQAELWNSKQGQNYEDDLSATMHVTRQVCLYYFHVPLLFKYSGGAQYPTRFYIMGGPQFSFLSNAEITYSGDSVIAPYKIDAKNKFQKQDIELVLDLGSDFNLYKRFYMNAGLRFNYGLMDINSIGYRIAAGPGPYHGSYNILGGVHLGVHYILSKASAPSGQ